MSETRTTEVSPVPQVTYRDFSIDGPSSITYSKIDVRRHREYYSLVQLNFTIKHLVDSISFETDLFRKPWEDLHEKFEETSHAVFRRIKLLYSLTRDYHYETNSKFYYLRLNLSFKLLAEKPIEIVNQFTAFKTILRVWENQSKFQAASGNQPEVAVQEKIIQTIKTSIDAYTQLNSERKQQEEAELLIEKQKEEAEQLRQHVEKLVKEAAKKQTDFDSRLQTLRKDFESRRQALEDELAKAAEDELRRSLLKLIQVKQSIVLEGVRLSPKSVEIAVEEMEKKLPRS